MKYNEYTRKLRKLQFKCWQIFINKIISLENVSYEQEEIISYQGEWPDSSFPMLIRDAKFRVTSYSCFNVILTGPFHPGKWYIT